MIALRSGLFLLWFFVISAAMHVALLPALLFPRREAVAVSKLWARITFFGLKWIVGLDFTVRGRKFIPENAALIASKHQSTWETLAFTALLKDPATVHKRELLWIPLFGWFLRKLQMIAIDRKSGAGAIRKMSRAATQALNDGRQIVIFPEGTRRKPGAPPQFKPGVAALYAELNVPCVPVALNSGAYWTGFLKYPGTIIIEFLPPIPGGLGRADFMRRLEETIEQNSNQLLK